MILTVTPNIAVDVTYRTPRLVAGSSLRVTNVAQRAGGKGVNVARILHGLGEDVMVTGLVGGATGRTVTDDLDAAGLAHDLVSIAGESRRTVALVDPGGRATMLLEPGPCIGSSEWGALVARVAALLGGASVLVLSGSLPDGAPTDGYAQLVDLGRAAGVPVLLDTSGPPLLAGVKARPDVVKPNLDELRAATGEVPSGADEVVHRSLALQAHGAGAVVCSLGRQGMLAVTRKATWHARLRDERAMTGNATGAGDAVVAALALGEREQAAWPQRLRMAAALSAAAVLHPLAGTVEVDTFRGLLSSVEVAEVGFARHLREPAS